MFVDLVGSTTLSARLDPEDLRELLAAYHQLVGELVKAYAGHVAQYLGDGALVYFGYPASHEDDGEGAIKAGLALLQRTRDLTIHGAEINVRIGIATGLVVVGDKAIGSDAAHEPRIMGETPNIAARLQGMARPGEIIIAESTHKLVGSLFEYESLGSVELKGVPRPVSAWKVLGATGVDDRFRALRSAATPFIGREEELDLLSRRWRQVTEEGGKTILICGEPGVGKSRLMAAARDQLRVSDDQIVTYFCSQSFTSTALFPVVRQITRTCGLTPEDTPAARRQKLETFLGPLANPEALALIIHLVSADAAAELDAIAHLSPAERRKMIFDLLIRHSEMLSAGRPLAVVFEDIHWADPSTLELLDLMVAQIEANRILVIATFRPEFQPRWAGLAHVTLLTLSRLPAIQQRRLIEAVAGSSDLLSPELVAEIAERTDGVPLFLEELTKAAIEANAAGAVVARVAGKGSGIPATLHASLMARLDRLGPSTRQLAQTAAVIGREFTRALLGSIWPRQQEEIETALNQLCSAGLIFVRGAGPDADYVFKHALIQDAAYGTLLREQRKELHRRIVDALEQNFPQLGKSQPALLAHHCAEGGLIAQAISYSLQAGRQSTSRCAMPEAVAQLRKALNLLSRLPDDAERWNLELDLQMALLPPLGATRGYSSPEAGEAIVRARTLAERTGRHEHLLRLLLGQWAFHLYRAEHRLALYFSERVERLGTERDDKAAQLHGRRTTGFSRLILGDVAAARLLLEDCSELSEPIYRTAGLSQDPYSLSLGHLAIAYAHLGHLQKSLSAFERALTEARRIKHAQTLAEVLLSAIWIERLLGREAQMELYTEELYVTSTKNEFTIHVAFALICRGRVMTMRNRPEEGLPYLNEGLAKLRASGTVIGTVNHPLTSLAEAHIMLNDPDKAFEYLAEATEIIEKTEERISEAEIFRLRGDAFNATGDRNQAESSYHQALEIARHQGAKLLELRAATSMSRLLNDCDRHAEAEELLKEMCNWFGEENSLPVVQEAQNMLAELALPALKLASQSGSRNVHS